MHLLLSAVTLYYDNDDDDDGDDDGGGDDDDEHTNMASTLRSFYSYIPHFPSPSPSFLISLYIIVIVWTTR